MKPADAKKYVGRTFHKPHHLRSHRHGDLEIIEVGNTILGGVRTTGVKIRRPGRPETEDWMTIQNFGRWLKGTIEITP